MLTVVLNIFGLICIIISLVWSSIIARKEKDIYYEISTIYEDIKYYFQAIEDAINDFDDLISLSLNRIESLQREYPHPSESIGMKEMKSADSQIIEGYKKDTLAKLTDTANVNEELYEKVMKLKNLGLSNEDIAKKLNKGIREVEIIIKIWGNIYRNY